MPRQVQQAAFKKNGGYQKPTGFGKQTNGVVYKKESAQVSGKKSKPKSDKEIDAYADRRRLAKDKVISTDDPIRMYLMQMGDNSMLSREEELEVACTIEATQTHYRKNLLASDYMLTAAVGLLRKVRNGDLRIDRTVEVSVTNMDEKRRILQQVVPNLKTIDYLMSKNREDFGIMISKSRSMRHRREAWQRLIHRRYKVVRLIEELKLRESKIQPIFEKLVVICNRMQTLKHQIETTASGKVLLGTASLEALRA